MLGCTGGGLFVHFRVVDFIRHVLLELLEGALHPSNILIQHVYNFLGHLMPRDRCRKFPSHPHLGEAFLHAHPSLIDWFLGGQDLNADEHRITIIPVDNPARKCFVVKEERKLRM